MGIFIFILFVCFVVLYNNLSSFKRNHNHLESLVESYREDNSKLRKEVADIQKILEGKTFTIDNTSSVSEEIQHQEIESSMEIIEEPIKEVVEETPAYFPPIIEVQLPIEESIESTETISPIEIEKEIFTFESTTAPRLENPTPLIDLQEEEVVQPIHEEIAEEVDERIYEESNLYKFFKNAEKQFADNWTGILGTAIMVLGIGYLSIYTALKVDPLYRILIIWLYASVLVGSYYFLKNNETWAKTGLWLRSAGASLFLFGTFGASQIPALTFIHNTFAGYSLIGLGIALNLYVGYIIKKQTFLSLHVILSMLILCVIPDKLLITLLLAAITSTIGIILSYKEKWEYHLLIVITAFIIFDIWFNAQGTTLTATENIFAIFGIITVAGSCMFMQYRSVYENTYFDKPAFITHLVNWVLFATGLLLHSTGSKFKTIVLFIAAVICFVIALRARKKKVYWLYHLDGMVSFVLFVLSVIMLNDWKVGIDIIACILYLVIVVCLFVVYKEKEALLYRIFLAINHLFAIGLIVFCILLLNNALEITKITNAFVTTILLFVIAISVPILSSIKKEFSDLDPLFGEKSLSLNGILAIAFSIFVILKANAVLVNNSFFYVVLVVALIWTFLQHKFKKPTFDIGRFVFYVLTISIGLFVIQSQEKNYLDWTFFLGILIIVTFNWFVKYFYKKEFIIKFIGIVGTNALLLLLSYKYLQSHTVIQILSLFGIALLNHEFLWANFKRKILTADNQRVLYICYFFFAIIGSFLFVIHSKNLSNTEIGLTCLAIALIEIYVLFAKRIRNNSEDTIKEWTNYNLSNSELLLFTIALFGFSCIQIDYTPLYFVGFALLSFIGFQKFDEFKRFNNYSFILLIGSVVLTLFVAVDSFDEKNKIVMYATQTATILLSFGYSYLQFKSKNEDEKRFITILPYIQNAWIIILLFIQVETAYLPIVVMGLALINFYLIYTKKIKILMDSVLVIALLAILASTFYSFKKWNAFELIDWALQLSGVVLGFVLVILLNKKEAIEIIKSNFLTYVLNAWIITLFFTQIETNYLPVVLMALALANFYLIDRRKIQIHLYSVLGIAMLGILVSSVYSIQKLNVFVLIDWIMQLSAVVLGLVVVLLLNKKEAVSGMKTNFHIILNVWLSIIMFTQLEHKWLPVYWAIVAILNLYLYHKKISQEKNISIVYYLLANLHLGFLSFNFYQSKFLAVYLLIFALLGVYIYLASKWLENFKLKNSLLIYPATLSIGCFLYLSFDKGILTFFWILEALGLLILGIILKEKYFRYVSLSLVGLCLIRLMFFDLSNSDFLIRAMVLVGVGVVLLVMNSLFKKYKDRFD